ncbi:hypothetical protein SLOPH_716 [Spraguea lophii 42_110]|uniref:Alpha/beta hydrolase n=1 Tax=Spraguea lophii (strain 42_110) TaxID=1358809 RepID=S7W4R9_SPRLO|nr:hypothetical protein SLOPH_716 [Spraguea lophii 42_110]
MKKQSIETNKIDVNDDNQSKIQNKDNKVNKRKYDGKDSLKDNNGNKHGLKDNNGNKNNKHGLFKEDDTHNKIDYNTKNINSEFMQNIKHMNIGENKGVVIDKEIKGIYKEDDSNDYMGVDKNNTNNGDNKDKDYMDDNKDYMDVDKNDQEHSNNSNDHKNIHSNDISNINKNEDNISDISVNYKAIIEINNELNSMGNDSVDTENMNAKGNLLENLKKEYKMKKKEKFFTKLVKNVFLKNNLKKNKNYNTFEFKNSRIYNFKNVYLQTDTRAILGAYLFTPKVINGETTFMLALHGIQDDRETFANAIDIENIVEMNNVVFIVDYQSFGDSSGEFIVDEIADNIKIAINYLKDKYQIENKQINIVAHSIGCAIILDYYKRLCEECIDENDKVDGSNAKEVDNDDKVDGNNTDKEDSNTEESKEDNNNEENNKQDITKDINNTNNKNKDNKLFVSINNNSSNSINLNTNISNNLSTDSIASTLRNINMIDKNHKKIIYKIILISPFRRILEVLEEYRMYKILNRLFSSVKKDITEEFNYDNINNLKKIMECNREVNNGIISLDKKDNIVSLDKELLVFHGTADITIPFDNGLDVANTVGCKIYRAHNDDHKSILNNPEVWLKINKFVKDE